ncbi:MAG: outer membrane beta-barrel protein [Cyclobacteriaceae bacterium]|nr:outer membrane beta-barrel protein [Cyclobacteriaceae bacterium]
MKSIFTTLLFILLATAAFAQYETVTKTKRPSIPGTFLVDLGVNRALNAGPTWKQGLWGSRTLNVYYQYPVRFGRSKFSFNPGVGLSMERWKFTNGAMLIDTVELVSFPTGAPQTDQVEQYDLLSPNRVYGHLASKSMFITNYLEMPLEFRFDTKPEDIARSFNVALGGRIGYRLNSFTKVKYKDDGEVVKVKDKRSFGLNDFRYGIYARIGVGGFSWFAFYNLSEMFEKGKGPQARDINSLTLGISVNGF